MSRSSRLRAQGGVTLIEALLALIVGVIALLGLYELVDRSNILTKQQTEVADVQQSARTGLSELARIIRQSRVGGLSFANAAVPIANNGVLLQNADIVGYGGLTMTDFSGTNHSIRPGTDVIEVRGVLLGDKYVLDEPDAVCSGSCGTTTKITVTIRAFATLGFANFPAGGKPSLAGKTKPFYFVVQEGENQEVTANGSPYLLPIYVAGLVNANDSGNWYSMGTGTSKCDGGTEAGKVCASDSDCNGATCRANPTFTFEMNPQDAGAQRLNATICGGNPCAPTPGKAVGGGAVDVVRFFADDRGDTHPTLVEAIWDPTTAKWDVQTLIEEVEDFQIAYGIDGAGPGGVHDGGVSPAAVDESAADADEWVGNFADEIRVRLPISAPDANHAGVDAFLDSSIPPGTRAIAALRSVWISLVVKSADPDLVFNGPGARGIKILDSSAVSFSASTGRPYRRRPLSLAVSLRNNAFFNK
jgi:hypothetical protein